MLMLMLNDDFIASKKMENLRLIISSKEKKVITIRCSQMPTQFSHDIR